MSIKTYAVYTSMNYTSSGRRPSILFLPKGDEEDSLEFRTRFGFPENGSGPLGVIRKHGAYGSDGWATPSSLGAQFNAMVDGTRTVYSGISGWSTRTFYICNFYEVIKVVGAYGSYPNVGRRTFSYVRQCNGRYWNRRGWNKRAVDTSYDIYRKDFSEEESKSIDLNFDSIPSVLRFCDYAESLAQKSTGGGELTIYQDNFHWFNADIGLAANDKYDGLLAIADRYLEIGAIPNYMARGLETAYTKACEGLPSAATNLAANILEAASLLKNIFSGEILGEIPKTARDAWLSYRYVYNTTKLDVRELKTTFSRIEDLARFDTVPVYGSYTRGGITYRVGFDIDVAQILPNDVSTTMRKFGLELSLLNVWDMIPYSFVVDWFVPIGKVLEYFESLDAVKYEPHDIWWSISTNEDGHDVFVRLPGRKLTVYPYLAIAQSSTKTVFLRIADSIALFT